MFSFIDLVYQPNYTSFMQLISPSHLAVLTEYFTPSTEEN